jgi:hypothetical protein
MHRLAVLQFGPLRFAEQVPTPAEDYAALELASATPPFARYSLKQRNRHCNRKDVGITPVFCSFNRKWAMSVVPHVSVSIPVSLRQIHSIGLVYGVAVLM